ncbi:hypothetical protein [Pseudonocardia aurantiaca]|uniref:Acyl transferase n=1 Tax=Pseudonocardia aurantiaca TaxID=75290 RepID=A0ABW4FLX4_9PSEU
MTRLLRAAAPAAAALLAGLVLAACGNAPGSIAPGPAGPATASSAPSGTRDSGTPSGPTGGRATEPAQPVELPWPAHSAADAAALQTAADSGSQPWLLDPSEVAISYAAAAHGWAGAEAYPGPDGTSVDVRNPDGERLTLTLAQPARTGDTGIWVVTAERPV